MHARDRKAVEVCQRNATRVVWNGVDVVDVAAVCAVAALVEEDSCSIHADGGEGAEESEDCGFWYHDARFMVFEVE